MEDKKEYITKKDRTKVVRDFDYGEVVANGWEDIDLPKIAEVEYRDGEKRFSDYRKLDSYIEKEFIPMYVRMKKNNNPLNSKGEMYPSIQLNHIVDLRLSHDEMQHLIYYLNKLGIRVGGKSSTIDYDIPNYDYITTYKTPKKEDYKKDHEEELKLFEELKKTNNSEIRDKIIINNMRLAQYLAHRYALISNIDYNELESYAYEGLINAVDKFDYTLGNRFSTFAYPSIEWKLKSAIAINFDNGKVGKNNYYYELKPYIETVQETEGKTLREDPRLIDEVIDLMYGEGKITYRNAELYRKYMLANLEFSLDSDNIEIVTDGEIDKVMTDSYSRDLSSAIQKILDTFTEREKYVIINRFGLNGNSPKTLEEIGKELGIAKQTVKQIEAKALRKLRYPSRAKLIEGFWDTYNPYIAEQTMYDQVANDNYYTENVYDDDYDYQSPHRR